MATSSETIDVYSVFIPNGIPTYTYIDRNNGKYEKRIDTIIRKGNIAFIHGPSKHGKSVLGEAFAQNWGEQLHRMNCNNFPSLEAFFEKLAQELNIPFQSVEETAKGGAAGAKFGAAIKAKLPFVEAGIDSSVEANSSKSIRQAQSYKPSVLQRASQIKRVMIIDNFHYIRDRKVQEDILRELRDMTERERFGIIIIAITDNPNYLQGISGELVNRCGAITMDKWTPQELERIPFLGFAALNVGENAYLNQALSDQCFGSPAIMQEICLQVALSLTITQRSKTKRQIESTNLSKNFANIFKTSAEDSINMHTPYLRLIELANDIRPNKQLTLRANRGRNISEDKLISLPEAIIQLIVSESFPYVDVLALRKRAKRFLIEPLDDISDDELIGAMEALSLKDQQLMEDDEVKPMIEAPVLEWNRRKKILTLKNPYFAFYVTWSGHIVGE